MGEIRWQRPAVESPCDRDRLRWFRGRYKSWDKVLEVDKKNDEKKRRGGWMLGKGRGKVECKWSFQVDNVRARHFPFTTH